MISMRSSTCSLGMNCREKRSRRSFHRSANQRSIIAQRSNNGQGKDAVLRAIETAVKVNSNASVGFVLDADDDISARWESVARRLQNVGVDIGAGLDPAGFLGESSEYGTRVGVWLMPDNEQAGRLEDFLEGLVDRTNPLLPHAQEATDGAKALGAAFSDTKTSKAVLHAWLAWQQEPGRPYGIAIKSESLRYR